MQSIRLTRQYFAFYLPPFVDPPQILHNVFRFEVWTHTHTPQTLWQHNVMATTAMLTSYLK